MKDYQQFAQPLRLPINGKVYDIPPIGINDALIIQGVIDGEDKTGLKDQRATELWKLALGAAWDQMLADNVPADAVARAGYTALADITNGRDAATDVWEREDLPEALAASTPKPTSGQATRRTTRTAAANTTRSRASGTGTRKRKPPASSAK